MKDISSKKPELISKKQKKKICWTVYYCTCLNILRFITLIVCLSYQDGLPGFILIVLFFRDLYLLISESKPVHYFKQLHAMNKFTIISVQGLFIYIYLVNIPVLSSFFSSQIMTKFIADESFTEFSFDSRRLLALGFLYLTSCISTDFFDLQVSPLLQKEPETVILNSFQLFNNYLFNRVENYVLILFKKVSIQLVLPVY